MSELLTEDLPDEEELANPDSTEERLSEIQYVNNYLRALLQDKLEEWGLEPELELDLIKKLLAIEKSGFMTLGMHRRDVNTRIKYLRQQMKNA